MNKYEEFVKFTINRLKERALESKLKCKKAVGTKDFIFYEGRNLAFYEVLDMIKNDTTAFQIHPKDIGLHAKTESLLYSRKTAKPTAKHK